MPEPRPSPIVPDTRRPRRVPADRFPSLTANILAGPAIQLIEVGPLGVLLESDVRLTPGAGICLNIALEGDTYLASGRIVKVDASLSGGHVTYRAEVTLDNELPAFSVAEESAASAPSGTRAAAPRAGDQEPPMESDQQLQLLKTALRSSETHRKQLAEQYQSERAKWDEQRKALEQRLTTAEQKFAELGRQTTAAKDQDKSAAAKIAQEQAAWAKERAGLQEQLKQARITAERVAGELGTTKQEAGILAQKHAQEQAARNKEQTAFNRERETWAKEREGWAKERDGWTKERETLKARVQQLEAGTKEAARQLTAARGETASAQTELAAAREELASARERELRLTRTSDEQRAALEAALEEQQRTAADLERVRAALAAAEQAVAAHEQERQSWTSHKERITSRLQLTERWCADQQELLYALRQQVGNAFTLLDGWKPPRLEAVPGVEDGEATPTPAKPARKATA